MKKVIVAFIALITIAVQLSFADDLLSATPRAIRVGGGAGAAEIVWFYVGNDTYYINDANKNQKLAVLLAAKSLGIPVHLSYNVYPQSFGGFGTLSRQVWAVCFDD